MKPLFSPQFIRTLEDCPQEIQQKFRKQLRMLLQDIRYPSLRAKKYNETNDIWQARIDHRYRFYFKVNGDTYILINIKRHAD